MVLFLLFDTFWLLLHCCIAAAAAGCIAAAAAAGCIAAAAYATATTAAGLQMSSDVCHCRPVSVQLAALLPHSEGMK